MRNKIKSFFTCAFVCFFPLLSYSETSQNNIPEGDVGLEIVTARGVINVDLFASSQSDMVHFFVKQVRLGAYNQTIFHRVIEGFVLQGGAYDPSFNLKENNLNQHSSFSVSPLKNNYGTFSLILRKDNSLLPSLQFFINLAQNDFLNSPDQNYHYQVIGKVVGGMDVVEKLAHIKIGQREGMYNVPFYPAESLIKQIIIHD